MALPPDLQQALESLMTGVEHAETGQHALNHPLDLHVVHRTFLCADTIHTEWHVAGHVAEEATEARTRRQEERCYLRAVRARDGGEPETVRGIRDGVAGVKGLAVDLVAEGADELGLDRGLQRAVWRRCWNLNDELAEVVVTAELLHARRPNAHLVELLLVSAPHVSTATARWALSIR